MIAVLERFWEGFGDWAAFWELFGRRVAIFRGLKKAVKKVQRQKPMGGVGPGVGEGSTNGKRVYMDFRGPARGGI